jgi:hypothetical protein
VQLVGARSTSGRRSQQEPIVFDAELSYFIEHQDELVALYQGKVLVIRGREIAGVYDSPLQAYLEARRRFDAGTYMIQPCVPGPRAYTVTINSSVVC